jgi:Starch-binding associating with outer membrane
MKKYKYETMKQVKNFFSWRILSILLLCSIIVATSCTDKFEEINTNPSTLPKLGSEELLFLFSKAQSSATQNGWNYQVSQNLFADQYAQYFGCRATYFASDRMFIVMNWVSAAFDPMYTDVVPQLQTLMSRYDPQSVDADGIPDYTKFTTQESAMASIMWVHAFHQVTDYWGPIPYFKVGVVAKSVPYDAQNLIYDDFFKRLASAVTVIKSASKKNLFGSFDLIYGGKEDRWIKFANTLRLRLALRISAVDPARAKAEAEAAVAGGIMTGLDDDALIKRSNKGADFNGLSIMSPWDEFRMSASMESALTGYSDPRLEIYFQPALATGTYEGLRNGLSVADLGLDVHSPNRLSHTGVRWSDFKTEPNPDYDGTSKTNKLRKADNPGQGLEISSNVMHTAEAYFLRAEGALNGWNMGGTAQTFYEAGIKASMNQWGITNDAAIVNYINSPATPIAPNDFITELPGKTSPAMNTTSIKFGGTVAMQREQIAMQKWLALFPNGMEAWADYRRQHNNLHLYPIPNSDNSDIAAADSRSGTVWLRRIPFLSQEVGRNKDGVNGGVTKLGGPDKVTTSLWWDKN